VTANTRNGRTLVLVHTPKTAGKSLRQALEAAHGSRLRLHYSNPLKIGPLRRSMQRLRGRFAVPSELHESDCVFGHVSLARYRHAIAGGYADGGMFFREPLDLLVSFYFYHQAKRRGATGKVDPAQGLLALARGQNMRGFYRRFLGGFQPEDLAFIGVFEELDASIARLETMLGRTLEVGRRNITRARPWDAGAYLAELGIRDRVMALQRSNIALYRRAMACFSALRG